MDKCPISGSPCPHKKCIHTTEVSNYEATETKNMCAFCGLPYLAKEGGEQFDMAPHKLYQAINTLISNKTLPETAIKTSGCPTCGHTVEDIIATGKMGCGNCYKFYKKNIMPLIEKCQFGAIKHVGKHPKQSNPRTLEDLEKQLKEATKEEKYELAAKLRDEIKKIKGQ